MKEEQNKLLISEIKNLEIKSVICHLKPNKAAGPDGFPSEWYKEMKCLLIPTMKATYNQQCPMTLDQEERIQPGPKMLVTWTQVCSTCGRPALEEGVL